MLNLCGAENFLDVTLAWNVGVKCRYLIPRISLKAALYQFPRHFTL